MRLFQAIAEWLRGRGLLSKKYPRESIVHSNGDSAKKEAQREIRVCTHERANPNRIVVAVFGVTCDFVNAPMCAACTEPYLNEMSTRCAVCKKPIFPGSPVGAAWEGAFHPFTHLTFDCCESAGLYCGRWGEGRFISLHELDPEKYPEGTSTVVDHVLKTGEAAFEAPS